MLTSGTPHLRPHSIRARQAHSARMQNNFPAGPPTHTSAQAVHAEPKRRLIRHKQDSQIFWPRSRCHWPARKTNAGRANPATKLREKATCDRKKKDSSKTRPDARKHSPTPRAPRYQQPDLSIFSLKPTARQPARVPVPQHTASRSSDNPRF